ncbi:kinase-like protein [Panus rudis PR-1116 ss-1]|nr:kinase-like protein [Panus rudis PR-1116 ss-1]
MNNLFNYIARLLFPLRRMIAAYLYPQPQTEMNLHLQLDPFTFAKGNYAPITFREAEALRFVREQTTLPVPRVYDVWVDAQDPELAWMTMENIKGVSLYDSWPRLTPSQKERVASQVVDFLRQLRAIPPPVPTKIASCSGGPIYDSGRIAGGNKLFGPFDSEEDFHLFLHGLATRDLPPQFAAKVPKQANGHDIVFTHADFGPSQILLDPNDLGRIVAVLDWEFASWYPAYWEYTKAISGFDSRLDKGTWREIVGKATGFFDVEAEIDMKLVAFQGIM